MPPVPESIKMQQPLVFADYEQDYQKLYSSTVKVPQTARTVPKSKEEIFSSLTFSNDKFTKRSRGGDVIST
jgi:hypothetical protein